jgi:hypothetical protein
VNAPGSDRAAEAMLVNARRTIRMAVNRNNFFMLLLLVG